jgi:hypothetical protein
MLGDDYVPRASILEWQGPGTANIGSPLEIRIP